MLFASQRTPAQIKNTKQALDTNSSSYHTINGTNDHNGGRHEKEALHLKGREGIPGTV